MAAKTNAEPTSMHIQVAGLEKKYAGFSILHMLSGRLMV
jgi:hypothetical protein